MNWKFWKRPRPSLEAKMRMQTIARRYNARVRWLLSAMAIEQLKSGWEIDRDDSVDDLHVDWWVKKAVDVRMGREQWHWMIRLCFDQAGTPSHFEIFSASSIWNALGPPRHGNLRAGLGEDELQNALAQARRDGPVHGLMYFWGVTPLWITL